LVEFGEVLKFRITRRYQLAGFSSIQRAVLFSDQLGLSRARCEKLGALTLTTRRKSHQKFTLMPKNTSFHHPQGFFGRSVNRLVMSRGQLIQSLETHKLILMPFP
jgi:hypothetical protein